MYFLVKFDEPDYAGSVVVDKDKWEAYLETLKEHQGPLSCEVDSERGVITWDDVDGFLDTIESQEDLNEGQVKLLNKLSFLQTGDVFFPDEFPTDFLISKI